MLCELSCSNGHSAGLRLPLSLGSCTCESKLCAHVVYIHVMFVEVFTFQVPRSQALGNYRVPGNEATFSSALFD